MKTKSFLQFLAVCGWLLCASTLGLFPAAARAEDAPGVVDQTKVAVQDAAEKAKDAAQEASDSVADAGRKVSDNFEELWRRADEGRLKNRSPDEIAAWVIMGVLVGAVAGMMTSFKPSGLGKVGRLGLGLAGAFLGGIAGHVTKLDFGMGPVLIRYEELLFSLAGAILLIVIARLLRGRVTEKSGE